jgi:tetratricopeptide (TPR) repeat protein
VRAALELCRKLRERSLTTWTASELALILLLRGDREAARETLEEPTVQAQGDPGSELALRVHALVDLADGDTEGALEHARRALELTRTEGWPNPVAWAINWTGTIFGADAVGGERALQEARDRLESMHWTSALEDRGMLGIQAVGGADRTEPEMSSRPGP